MGLISAVEKKKNEPGQGSNLPYVTSLDIKLKTQSTFPEGKFHIEASLCEPWRWEAMVKGWRALEGETLGQTYPPSQCGFEPTQRDVCCC